MGKTLIVIAFSFFSLCLFAESNKPDDVSKQSKIATRRLVQVRTYIHHISDLNFRDQDYKIELWLYLISKDSLSNSIIEQIQVKDAKELTVSIIPQWKGSKLIRDTVINDARHKKDSSFFRKLLKINCTMKQNWDLDGYPFDTQSLDIIIYTVRPLKWLSFIPVPNGISYASSNINNTDSIYNIENGWSFDHISLKTDTIKDIFESEKKYSALHYQIPIKRLNEWSLFFKLFLGMYVAVMVAFLALFIKLKEVEPRFGLPVGGLFAAIANKYIIESLLPPTSEFTLVDYLHSASVIFILIILAYSALLIHLKEKKKSHNIKLFNQVFITLVFIGYAAINFYFILWGWD